MIIIFLDIDGVLSTIDTYSEAEPLQDRDLPKLYNQTLISETCVNVLNKIIEYTGAKVVISSAWRYGQTIEFFQNLFNKRGFVGEVIGMTPTWNQYKNDIDIKYMSDLETFWKHERGNEINMWITRNKEEIKSFIIIDDESSDIYPVFPDRLLVTSMESGLKEEYIDDAITILETPYE